MDNGSDCRGKILSGVGGRYTVKTDNGVVEEIPAKGAFRHERIKPLPGDEVLLRPCNSGCVISGISPRKNVLIRPAVANLDTLYVIISCKTPDPDPEFADKVTVLCEKNGIRPVIVITKSELDETVSADIAGIYDDCGYKTFITSSESGAGVGELREYILSSSNSVSAFCGVSGAGKSTLIAKMFPQLEKYCSQGELSEKINRGKNTTRAVTLFEIADTVFLADTPGFSLLDFERFDFCTKDELPYLFPEMQPYLLLCKYTKCSHTKEDGCMIRDAVEKGDINVQRYGSYLSIYEKVKNKKEWDN